eukprot:1661210-Pleurochrysis_carterae.AAC.1
MQFGPACSRPTAPHTSTSIAADIECSAKFVGILMLALVACSASNDKSSIPHSDLRSRQECRIWRQNFSDDRRK